MKKNSRSLILLLLILPLMISCSKDSTNDSGVIVKDFDGNVYHTVTIGYQTWMVENLKVTHYRNGDAITNITDGSSSPDGSYQWYNNDITNKATYGAMYNWVAVNDIRKIVPMGWHIPTKAEWETLINYLGGTNEAGGKLKSTTLWNTPNVGATNESGFTANPGGYQEGMGDTTYGMGDYGNWWSSSEAEFFHTGMGSELIHDGAGIEMRILGGSISVRLLKDY